MTKLIKISNIYKSFGPSDSKVEVLKDLSLEIDKGEIVAVTGPSGSGKSTLMHIMSGLEKPDSGTVFFEDTSIYTLSGEKLNHHRNSNIGFVFQFHYLLDDFTALENVMIPALLGGIGKKEATTRAEELLERVGLSHRLTHMPKEMSGGEQQRAAVARALMNNPRIIFADEPKGNLDKINSDMVENLLFSVAENNTTVVLVTHDQGIAARCHRNIHLEKV